MAAGDPSAVDSFNEKSEKTNVDSHVPSVEAHDNEKKVVLSSEGAVTVQAAKTKDTTPVSFTHLFRCGFSYELHVRSGRLIKLFWQVLYEVGNYDGSHWIGCGVCCRRGSGTFFHLNVFSSSVLFITMTFRSLS